MEPIVCPTNLSHYGGKAAGLIRLRDAGFTVPPFALIRPEHLAKDLGQAMRQLDPAGRFAVRSSATVEDGVATAMAGLFESFLDVPAGQIPEKTADCLASGQSDRVRRFLRAAGIAWDGRMTVIVQAMIQPQYSGVLFTINPQGILNEMTAVIGAGPGSGVVDDTVPVTTWIRRDPDGLVMTARQPGSPQIPEGLSEALADLGRRLRREFVAPMDAEFAWRDGRLWILQARPVTALPSDRITVLDSSNISESYPGLTLPLSIDFARRAYAGIFQGLMQRMFGSDLPRELSLILDEMVAASSGRMYYRLDHWYQVMKLLPLSAAYIGVWQEMMGVRQPDVMGEKILLTKRQRILGLLRLLRAMLRVPRDMTALEAAFRRYEAAFRELPVETMSAPQLDGLLAGMKRELLACWDVTLLNDIQAFIYSSLLKKTDRSGQRLSTLTELGEVASLRPALLLRRMARVAPADLLALRSPDAVTAYLASDEPFAAILRDYIEEYGDRYLEELKLESRTFRSDPQLLVRALADLKASPDSAPLTGAARQTADRTRDDGIIFRRAARAIRHREIARLDRTRIFGMARTIFLRLGGLLAQENQLEDPRDVFWLTQEEALTGGPLLKETVRRRRARYAVFARLPTLTRLEFAGEPFDRTLPGEVAAAADASGPLRGTGASPGIVRAPILRVEDPRRCGDVTGKILVTRQTDPGWVFLIIRAKGVIAEKGSLLSHTAIIARELGKPVVVGVTGALSRLRDGEWVQIDGRSGEIRREETDADH